MGEQIISIIAGLLLSWLIFKLIKGDRELTDEKIDLNRKLLNRQKDNSTLILYLRDFAVDGLKSATVKVGHFKSTFIDTNFETELSISAGQVGYFIAVGINSETGDVGAHRYTVEDEHWKDRVHDLMEKSSMILIRPSLSVGLIWELEQLVKKNYLHKTVICFHKKQDDRNNYKLFRNVTKDFIKLPTSFFASKFMCFDELQKIRGYSFLEATPIFKDLLHRGKMRLSKLKTYENEEEVLSRRELLFLLAILLSVFGFVFYLKWSN